MAKRQNEGPDGPNRCYCCAMPAFWQKNTMIGRNWEGGVGLYRKAGPEWVFELNLLPATEFSALTGSEEDPSFEGRFFNTFSFMRFKGSSGAEMF